MERVGNDLGGDVEELTKMGDSCKIVKNEQIVNIKMLTCRKMITEVIINKNTRVCLCVCVCEKKQIALFSPQNTKDSAADNGNYPKQATKEQECTVTRTAHKIVSDRKKSKCKTKPHQ